MKKERKQRSFITGRNCLRTVQHYFPKVLKVMDGTAIGVVEVTAADNAHSDVRSHRTCAMAIASRRCFGADGALVGLSTSFIIRGTTAYRYANPPTVSREITSFDRKAGFDVGTYHLSPPSPCRRLGAEKQTDPNRPSGGKKNARAYRHYTRNVRTTLGNIGIA